MADAALCAAVPDGRPRVTPAPALLPYADVGIVDEQGRWVVTLAKVALARNVVEVIMDELAHRRHAAVLPPSSKPGRRWADADLLDWWSAGLKWYRSIAMK